MSILTDLNITANEDGEMHHICAEGYKNGLNWEYVVSLTRVAADSGQWDAYDTLVEAGVIEDDDENIPADAYAWCVEDPHNTEWFATREDAVESFETMVSLFYDAEAECLDETVSTPGDGYNYDWMAENAVDFDMEALRIHAEAGLETAGVCNPAYVWQIFIRDHSENAQRIVDDVKRTILRSTSHQIKITVSGELFAVIADYANAHDCSNAYAAAQICAVGAETMEGRAIRAMAHDHGGARDGAGRPREIAQFSNIDERYGDGYPVTISDYLDLNPDGEFEERSDGIYENARGEWVQVAE